MCRIGISIGPEAEDLSHEIGALQTRGGNRTTEHWSLGSCSMSFNRFAVTSENLEHGAVPLENDRYAIAYNGEVYASNGEEYCEKMHSSDSEFALQSLTRQGVHEWLKHVDFQGTYTVIDKQENLAYIAVDQLNTMGCFYAEHNGNIVIASEYPVLHAMLESQNAASDAPINIVKNGHYLTVDFDFGSIDSHEYRPVGRQVFLGERQVDENVGKVAEKFLEVLKESVARRIPQHGPVGVLCSGGVDSSLILALTAEILRTQNELGRLQIFTYGDENIAKQESDLHFVHELLNELHLSAYLKVISPEDIRENEAALWRDEVLDTDLPRLIPPSISRTHVRHTCMESALFAMIAEQTSGELKVLLTGDAADEIFAGYQTMYDVENLEDLRENVRQKLNDFSLNDASRIALSCFHGCKAAQENSDNLDAPTQPMEARLPFTSHHVLDILKDLPPDYLVGNINGKLTSKFLLRIAALMAGVPEEIALRGKVPFNEGGSGTKNGESRPEEEEFIKDLYSTQQFEEIRISQGDLIQRLCIPEDRTSLAILDAANRAGLKRLMKGNLFREEMPDTIYSTLEKERFAPEKPLEYVS